MRSKMKEASHFQDWVIEKVLPSILDTGQYNVFERQDDTLTQHLDVTNQKNFSKKINGLQYNKGGIEAIKEYNTFNCVVHSGMKPKDLKQLGKNMGLKSKDLVSGKQVLRKLKPAVACSMSFADNLLYSNKDKTLQDISPITLKAIEVYDEMLKAGIIPIELKMEN
jgi:hypothetical protein